MNTRKVIDSKEMRDSIINANHLAADGSLTYIGTVQRSLAERLAAFAAGMTRQLLTETRGQSYRGDRGGFWVNAEKNIKGTRGELQIGLPFGSMRDAKTTPLVALSWLDEADLTHGKLIYDIKAADPVKPWFYINQKSHHNPAKRPDYYIIVRPVNEHFNDIFLVSAEGVDLENGWVLYQSKDPCYAIRMPAVKGDVPVVNEDDDSPELKALYHVFKQLEPMLGMTI